MCEAFGLPLVTSSKPGRDEYGLAAPLESARWQHLGQDHAEFGLGRLVLDSNLAKRLDVVLVQRRLHHLSLPAAVFREELAVDDLLEPPPFRGWHGQHLLFDQGGRHRHLPQVDIGGVVVEEVIEQRRPTAAVQLLDDGLNVKGGGKLDHGGGSKFLTAAWRGETSGSRSGRVLAGFLAVFEAIAVAVQLEDVDVMGQPVEQRASHPFGAEDLGLFVEGQIRGHARRCVLVALGEDLDQQLGAGLRQRDVAELGHDQ